MLGRLNWRPTLRARDSNPALLGAVELVLIAAAALLCARFATIVVAPPPRVVPTLPAARIVPPAQVGLLGSFDPFFRLSPATGPTVITPLDLQLFGIRQDHASGRGSAIIANPDGQQRSFTVGEEIVPGAKLAGVEIDHVTISRNGTLEQLYMGDDSAPPDAAAAQREAGSESR